MHRRPQGTFLPQSLLASCVSLLPSRIREGGRRVVGWFARKVDSLMAAVCAAVFALAASQFLAFVQQYRQRLGGHLDEAIRTREQVVNGEAYRGLTPTAREQMADQLGSRVEFLLTGDVGLREATFLSRPFVFLSHLDREIALATLAEFQPSLPLDAGSLIYGACGLLLGWLFWEGVKLPLRPFLRPAQP